MKVFVSLPITGKVEWARAEAARVKDLLERHGHDVVTPFDCAPDPDMTDGYYIGRCVEALLCSDRICQYPYCGGSKGCSVERHVADTYGIPSIEYPVLYEHTHGRYEREK